MKAPDSAPDSLESYVILQMAAKLIFNRFIIEASSVYDTSRSLISLLALVAYARSVNNIHFFPITSALQADWYLTARVNDSIPSDISREILNGRLNDDWNNDHRNDSSSHKSCS